MGLKEAKAVEDTFISGKRGNRAIDLFEVVCMCLCSDESMFLFPRILFKDKDRNWEEIESKLRSESEIPLQKASNKVERLLLLCLYLHLLEDHHLFFY